MDSTETVQKPAGASECEGCAPTATEAAGPVSGALTPERAVSWFRRLFEIEATVLARSHGWCEEFEHAYRATFPEHRGRPRDAGGWSCHGWGTDQRTRQGYDRQGCDVDGFAQSGFNRDGYDRNGFNRDGVNRDGERRYPQPSLPGPGGYDQWSNLDRDGYDRRNLNRDGYDRNGYAWSTDRNGYDREGYDRHGFNREGYNRYGFDRNGFNADGFDWRGRTAGGFYSDGFDEYNMNADGWDRWGYNRQGLNSEGFDRWGYNSDGYNRDGFNRNGLNAEGYNSEGFTYDGYNRLGVHRDGYTKPFPDLTRESLEALPGDCQDAIRVEQERIRVALATWMQRENRREWEYTSRVNDLFRRTLTLLDDTDIEDVEPECTYGSSCCNYCSDCETHHEDGDGSTDERCNMGHCHDCEHVCAHY